MLARKPVFWLLALAASSSSLCGYGLAVWTPSVLERSFGLGLIERGQFLASVILIGGCSGVFGGGWLADRLGVARRGWYAKLPAIAWLITAPTFAAGLLAPNLLLAWPLLSSECPQYPVAWSGDHRGPASRAAPHEGDGLGQFPTHQQSHRPW